MTPSHHNVPGGTGRSSGPLLFGTEHSDIELSRDKFISRLGWWHPRLIPTNHFRNHRSFALSPVDAVSRSISVVRPPTTTILVGDVVVGRLSVHAYFW